MPTRILTAPAGAVRRAGIRKAAAGPADLHAVFDALPDGILVWDAEDKLVYVNLTGRTLLAPLDPDLGPGRRWSDLAACLVRACCPGIEDAASALASLAALRCGAQAWLEAAMPDGGWLRAIDRPLSDGRSMSVFSEVSALKQRESDGIQWWQVLEHEAREAAVLTQDLIAARQAAEDANDAKSAFLASMSHELRTPLNAILGFTEIIRDQLFGRQDIDRYSAYAADVHASGQHLLALINDILDLSKVEAGKLTLHEEVIDLDSVLAAALFLMQGEAQKRDITLRRLARERVALRADASKLKQCLLNVLSNAIKFTPPGGVVTIKVSANPQVLCIAVVDTGIGIAPEDFAKVFEPFGQVEDPHIQSHHGTGLGMPITKSFIEQHGGTIELFSEVGRGTTVHLNLPFSRVETHDLFAEDDYPLD